MSGAGKKSTRSTYSHPYPDTIQFREGGLYFGQKDPPGTFTQWDAGTFEVIDSEQIRVSTANDAIVAYGFSLSNNVLKFVDPDGCEFSYRRVS